MNGNRLVLFIAVVVLIAGVSSAIAVEPPELLSYQGVLRSATGLPLNGTHDLVFRFTDAPSGGTLLLTDYHTGPDAVVVEGGLFTALLGGGTLSPGTENSLADIFANYAPVWVEVQVGAETLNPRVQIVSTGFALNAGRFGGQLPDGFIDTSVDDQVKQGALTTNTGIVVQSEFTSGGVRGVNATTMSTEGIGVLGSALATSGLTEGVRGQTTSPQGRGVVGGAFATSGVTVGVLGETQSTDGTGVHGRATAVEGGTVGVAGEIYSTLGTGIAGVAHATSGEAWGVYGETASADGYGVVSVGDSITAGDVYATGTKFFLTEHPSAADRAIRFACLEGGEVGVYQRGVGQLTGGVAQITLPDPFPLVATGRINVQVTAHEESGSLFVPSTSVTTSGFTVRESAGRSNAAFSYVVVAERAGYKGTKPVRPISISDKIITSTRFTPSEKAALRTTLPVHFDKDANEDLGPLYSALHAGDFDDSCRLLGGCGNGGIGPIERDRREDSGDRRGVVSRSVGSGPEPPAATNDGDDRQTRTERGPQPLTQAQSPTEPPLHPASLAMLHQVSESVLPGDVVVLDPEHPDRLRRGREAADPRVIGVVAFIKEAIPPGGKAPVAFAGLVPCRVDASYGWIRPGDLLVASPTPGHAMRADDPAPGTVIGKALESVDVGQDTISILLMPR